MSDSSDRERRNDLGCAVAERFRPLREQRGVGRAAGLPGIGVLAQRVAEFGLLTGRSLLARRAVGAVSSIGPVALSSLSISVPHAELWLPYLHQHRRPDPFSANDEMEAPSGLQAPAVFGARGLPRATALSRHSPVGAETGPAAVAHRSVSAVVPVNTPAEVRSVGPVILARERTRLLGRTNDTGPPSPPVGGGRVGRTAQATRPGPSGTERATPAPTTARPDAVQRRATNSDATGPDHVSASPQQVARALATGAMSELRPVQPVDSALATRTTAAPPQTTAPGDPTGPDHVSTSPQQVARALATGAMSEVRPMQPVDSALATRATGTPPQTTAPGDARGADYASASPQQVARALATRAMSQVRPMQPVSSALATRTSGAPPQRIAPSVAGSAPATAQRLATPSPRTPGRATDVVTDDAPQAIGKQAPGRPLVPEVRTEQASDDPVETGPVAAGAVVSSSSPEQWGTPDAPVSPQRIARALAETALSRVRPARLVDRALAARTGTSGDAAGTGAAPGALARRSTTAVQPGPAMIRRTATPSTGSIDAPDGERDRVQGRSFVSGGRPDSTSAGREEHKPAFGGPAMLSSPEQPAARDGSASPQQVGASAGSIVAVECATCSTLRSLARVAPTCAQWCGRRASGIRSRGRAVARDGSAHGRGIAAGHRHALSGRRKHVSSSAQPANRRDRNRSAIPRGAGAPARRSGDAVAAALHAPRTCHRREPVGHRTLRSGNHARPRHRGKGSGHGRQRHSSGLARGRHAAVAGGCCTRVGARRAAVTDPAILRRRSSLGGRGLGSLHRPVDPRDRASLGGERDLRLTGAWRRGAGCRRWRRARRLRSARRRRFRRPAATSSVG